jgi:hypothetical protein
MIYKNIDIYQGFYISYVIVLPADIKPILRHVGRSDLKYNNRLPLKINCS